MLYNRRDYISKQCLKNLYFALVFSRLQYGILIYGFATASTLKPLLICCNKILRTLQFQNRFSNVKQLYVYYNTLSIFQLHKLHIGKFVFKSLNCDFLVPDVIREIFALSNDNSRKIMTQDFQAQNIYIIVLNLAIFIHTLTFAVKNGTPFRLK